MTPCELVVGPPPSHYSNHFGSANLGTFFTFPLVLRSSWTTKAETSANKKLVGPDLLHRFGVFGVDSLVPFGELSRSGSGLGVSEDRLQC